MFIKLILTAFGIISGLLIVTLVLKIKKSSVKQISLDDLGKLYSKKVDQTILNEVKNKNIEFISGILKIEFSEDNKKVIITTDMYFQNTDKKWLQKNNKDYLNRESLTSESLEELKELREINYELTTPEELNTTVSN